MDLAQMKFKASWDEFSISDYLLFYEIQSDTAYSDQDKVIKSLAFLSGEPEKEFKRFALVDLYEQLGKLSYLTKSPEGKLKKYYHLAGRRYKLVNNIHNLTSGQYIDLEKYASDPARIEDNVHLIVAVLLLPCRKKTFAQRIIERSGLKSWPELENYLETPIDETSEIIFNNMSITDAYAISVFFYALAKRFIETIQDCLLQQMKKKTISLSKTLPETSRSLALTRELAKATEKLNLIESGVGLYA